MNSSAVDVILPTFNQAPYIQQFLASLSSQTTSDWRLLARDDVSSDETPAILQRWQSHLGSRMEILSDSGKVNLRYHGNFSRLLAESTAPYVMLADPDDVWMADKIEASVAVIKRMEDVCGASTPCLAHSDLFMVDRELRPIAPSLWSYQGLYPKRFRTLSRFLVENTVWGCTLVANRALVNLAGATPEAAFHTDWWMGLVASTFGRIEVIDRPTIYWRRHGANISQTSSMLERLSDVLRPSNSLHQRLQSIMVENLERAAAFHRRYDHLLSEKHKRTLSAFQSLPNLSPVQRRLAIIKYHFLFTSHRRTLGSLVYV